ncbi:MAG TPA: non-ribosomal peptide synthetase, partial [Burkholderiaceae bacterium]|nr:non-ribosomal peptide synthetase [Burkholderiaceae bacterium]
DRCPPGTYGVLEVEAGAEPAEVQASSADATSPRHAPSFDSADPAIADDRIAYAIYTSGSTGAPKAVRVGRQALAIHLRACRSSYELDPGDRVLCCADASVDASLEQILAPLAAGACVVIAEPGAWTLHELAHVVRAQAITVADLPTALWHAIVVEDEAALQALPLRLLLVGGEPALRARRPTRPLPYRVLNAYGPTEATITACVGEIGLPDDATAGPYESIGRPIGGGRAYLLDEALAPVPRGLAGELCLAGPRLAHDYFGRPDLTRDAFVADPYGPPGSRLYRTGDLARWRADGRLDYLGRLDGQLKVRGFRVEPAEVEAALTRCASVLEAAVYAEDDAAGSQRLVAAVVVRSGAPFAPADLARALRERLPDPMIPAAWRLLDQLPRTPGGKIDRRALAALRTPLADAAAAHATPRSDVMDSARDTELRAVLAIVHDLLPDARAAAHDDLIELGLHSVLVLRFLAQCRQRLEATLKVRDVYHLATPAAIAAHIRASR